MAFCGINLTSDITMEIFSRLPVKTLSRFRCVSKSWYDSISDPIFQRLHRQRSRQSPFLLRTYYTGDSTPGFINFRFALIDKRRNLIKEFVKVLPTHFAYPVFTCLGLVCLYNWTETYICNPTSEELIVLPPSQNFESYYQRNVALGYVPSTEEYKVFRIIRPNYDHVQLCEVLTLGTKSDDCWRAVGSPPCRFNHDLVFANGAIHLVPDYFENCALGDKIDDPQIARFHLEKENWSLLPIPGTVVPESPQSLALREVGGVLCLADFGPNQSFVDLWFLKDNEKQAVWVKEYTIDLSSQLTSIEYGDVLVVPRAIEEDGRVLLEDQNYGGRLFYYDPRGRCFEEFGAAGIERYRFTTCCVESFVSLDTKFVHH